MRPLFRELPDLKLLVKQLKLQYGAVFQDLLTLKAGNTLLMALAGAATFFLILDFWMGAPTLHTIQRLELAAKKTDIGNMAIERLNSLAVYLQDITQRNIFSLTAAPVPQVQPPEIKKPPEVTD